MNFKVESFIDYFSECVKSVFVSAVLPPVLVPRQQDMPTKVPDAPSLDDLGRPADNITISQEMSDQGMLLE